MPLFSESSWIKTTCPYCGVGCGVEARVTTSNSIEVRGDQSHPANYGRLCSKGIALGDTVINTGRLLEPMIQQQAVSWNQALDKVAQGFSESIQNYGPDSVAFYVSGQLLTEDYYVANKLMKGYIGSGNIDTNSRLCMSSSVAGHKRAFGSDTVPNCYEDFEQADLILLVGSNLAWCHPVLYQRIKAAKAARPNLKVVVVDPRLTDSCDEADLHLAIQPGTDVLLFNGLLNYLAEHKHLNQTYIEAHTQGLSDALASARADTGEKGLNYPHLSRLTGLPIATLDSFYQWFAETEKVLSIYSQGVNQSSAGVDKVNSILNCHLATGRIGRKGCGPFSITGQPNAMGGREVGGLANMLAAHMEFDRPEHRQNLQQFWQTDHIATRPGLKAVELFDAVAKGKIKALWIMATNPVVSMPDANRVKTALEQCPLVVVSDCIADTDTTRCADILLPAQGWAEKDGTVTNSERRISRQRALIPSNGKAKADWWIICQVALRMGFVGFNFSSSADIFREYAALTGFRNEGKRDLDISPLSTISDEYYEQLLPQQWPLIVADTDISQKRFFSEGDFYTDNRKGNLIPVRFKPPQTQVSSSYPMVLNSGRIRDQWHTMTRTGLAPQLNGHRPEPMVSINPQDARCFELSDGDIAQLNSRWGQAKARILISSEMNPGQLFMPMHWTAVDSSEGKVCPLISPDVDPISGQPELKFTPVSIQAWAFRSEAMVISRTELDTKPFDYWVRQRIQQGFLYYLASSQEGLLVTQMKVMTGQHQGVRLQYENISEELNRYALIINKEIHHAWVVAPRVNQDKYAWLSTLLTEEANRDTQQAILSGEACGSLQAGKTVCACKQVGESSIVNCIREQSCSSTEEISLHTQAGTGCGSCIPELGRLLREYGSSIRLVS